MGQVTGFLGPKAYASGIDQCPVRDSIMPSRRPRARDAYEKRERTKKRKSKSSRVVLAHLRERFRVRNPQAPHPVHVPELLEVLLERSPAPVAVVPADLARELEV